MARVEECLGNLGYLSGGKLGVVNAEWVRLDVVGGRGATDHEAILFEIINFLILIISSRYLGVSSRGDIGLFILNISIVQIISGIYTG